MINRRMRLAIGFLVTLAALGPLLASGKGSENQHEIIGSWRVLSYDLEFQDGSPSTHPLGSKPNGYMMFSADGRMMAYLESDARKAPQNDEERATAYRTLVAYTGRYQLNGDKWVTRVDGAWNVEWEGTAQERTFTLKGDELHVVAQWNRNALFGGKMTRGHLAFTREH